MANLSVSVVIPNWNGETKLKNNLPQVLKLKNILEVIVSDDASTDNSVEILEKNFPEVKVVRREKNGGFSSNVNLGVKNAKGDLVFLLNTDAAPEPDCLKYLLGHFENKSVFSISCNVGGSWSWARWKKGWFWHNQYGRENDTEAHQTLWASGGSGIFRKDLWTELGGLDELMNPFYVEDVDLGYRATKRGYINIFEPKAHVSHYKEKGVIEENFSKTRVRDVTERNTLILIWKNITGSGMVFDHIWFLGWRLIRHPKYWKIFLMAIMILPRILAKRKVESRKAKLRDREIFEKFVLE